MASVTQRIRAIQQPYGGYLKPSEFKIIEYNDNNTLAEENIHSSLVGLAVDYMTRYVMGSPLEEAFKISLIGAKLIDELEEATELLNNIDGLNSKSVFYACKLVGYDVCYRAGPMGYKPVDDIEADDDTINNIIIMVKRSIEFFNEYGPIILDGFTFEGGYTKIITTGDGDFLTKDTLWDFKVSSKKPTSVHTLQLLAYYIMGSHSIHKEFDDIEKLGIFNPRLNCVYLKDIKDIPKETIEEVSKEVIGYNNDSDDLEASNSADDEMSNYLSMEDIMNVFECSKYRIMKYYSEDNLPLQKINNKYYANKTDLYNWLQEKINEKKEEEEEKKAFLQIVISIIIIAIIIIMIIVKFFK